MTEKKRSHCNAPGCIEEPEYCEMIDSSNMSHTEKDVTVLWVCEKHVDKENATMKVTENMGDN